VVSIGRFLLGRIGRLELGPYDKAWRSRHQIDDGGPEELGRKVKRAHVRN